MGLTANVDLSVYQPINEPLHHDHDRFDFDGPSRAHRGDNDGNQQSSLSNLVQQLTSLVQQLQSALQQLQQNAGQSNPTTSPSSPGSSGSSGDLQGIIQQLQQLLQQLSQLTQGNQGDPSSGSNGASGSPGGPQNQIGQLLQELQQLLGQLNGQGPDQSGQGGGYGSQPSTYGSQPYGGPSSNPYAGSSSNQGSLQIEPNNTVNTGRFTVNVSNATGGELTVTDNNTGKTFTVWGDPHGTTPNGGTFDFQHHSLVYNLPDGTKIEVDPTQNSGVNYINSVEVTQGGAGVQFSGVNSGNITESAIPGGTSNTNQPVIGINVDNNDNQSIVGGPAINGNVGNIDQYATQQPTGYGSQGSGSGSGSGQIGEKLVHEGRELERQGHQLQSQGKYREGASLIRQGRHLEGQGLRLEQLAQRYGAQNNPQTAQQLQQIQQLIEQISALTQQISQANNSFANSYLNNQQVGAA